jgi:hypothetical protein
MKMDKLKMDNVYRWSKEFMKEKYSDEAPYFDIAWDIFKEVMEKEEETKPDLKEPMVRFQGDDTIMAPRVIHAFYTLYSELPEEMESLEDPGRLESKMTGILAKSKFSPEFSKEIVDFVMENPA